MAVWLCHPASFLLTLSYEQRGSTILRTSEQLPLVAGRWPCKVREIKFVTTAVMTEEAVEL